MYLCFYVYLYYICYLYMYVYSAKFLTIWVEISIITRVSIVTNTPVKEINFIIIFIFSYKKIIKYIMILYVLDVDISWNFIVRYVFLCHKTASKQLILLMERDNHDLCNFKLVSFHLEVLVKCRLTFNRMLRSFYYKMILLNCNKIILIMLTILSLLIWHNIYFII